MNDTVDRVHARDEPMRKNIERYTGRLAQPEQPHYLVDALNLLDHSLATHGPRVQQANDPSTFPLPLHDGGGLGWQRQGGAPLSPSPRWLVR